jgi:tRNA A37 threonylcarbamoyladenosine biosynthesis protein TsaE
MEFTRDQTEAIQTFIRFDKADAQRRCFVLKGYAGTGKTTLISYIVSNFIHSYRVYGNYLESTSME